MASGVINFKQLNSNSNFNNMKKIIFIFASIVASVLEMSCNHNSSAPQSIITLSTDVLPIAKAKKENSFQDSIFRYAINRNMNHCELEFQYFANTGNKAYVWQIIGDTDITRILSKHCDRKLLTTEGLTSQIRIHYDIFGKKVWWCAYLKGSGEEIFSIAEINENQKDSLLKKVNLEEFEKRTKKAASRKRQ